MQTLIYPRDNGLPHKSDMSYAPNCTVTGGAECAAPAFGAPCTHWVSHYCLCGHLRSAEIPRPKAFSPLTVSVWGTNIGILAAATLLRLCVRTDILFPAEIWETRRYLSFHSHVWREAIKQIIGEVTASNLWLDMQEGGILFLCVVRHYFWVFLLRWPCPFSSTCVHGAFLATNVENTQTCQIFSKYFSTCRRKTSSSEAKTFASSTNLLRWESLLFTAASAGPLSTRWYLNVASASSDIGQERLGQGAARSRSAKEKSFHVVQSNLGFCGRWQSFCYSKVLLYAEAAVHNCGKILVMRRKFLYVEIFRYIDIGYIEIHPRTV